MAMSPSSLLAKLDELRRWQQAQQERLLLLHQTRMDSTPTQLSHRQDSIIASTRIDDERKVDHEDDHQRKETNDEEGTVENVPKKPYLRRGTGLAKYGLQYGDQKNPFHNMRSPKIYKTMFHKRLEKIRADEMHTQKQPLSSGRNSPLQNNSASKSLSPQSLQLSASDIPKAQVDITPLKPPEFSIKYKAKWHTVDDYESPDIENTIDDLPPAEPRHKEETTEEIQAKQAEAKVWIENNPLLLECLQKLASSYFGKPDENGSTMLDQSELFMKLAQENDSTIPNTPSNNNNIHLVNYLQELIRGCEDPPGDLTTYENAIEKELRVFEKLEEKALNSSFSSTNSSVVELLASTPHRIVQHKVPTFETIQEGCNQEKYVATRPSAPCSQNSYTDSDTTIQESRSPATAKKMLVYEQSYCESEQSIASQRSDESSINSDDFESMNLTDRANIRERVNSSQRRSNSERIIMQSVLTMTDPVTHANEEVLKNKLQELEAEITSFRVENKKIEKLKNDLERQRLDYLKMKKTLEIEYNQKRDELEAEFEEERKKLAKEKLVFEKHTKETLNKPNRKEREEISNLKVELANVKENFKVKDTRNGTTQARLRTHIKSLEKDVVNLKEEVEKLQKTNARLQNQVQIGRKTKQDDTKMLHEINRNLSKLTKDKKISKTFSKSESTNEKLSADDSLVNESVSRTPSTKKVDCHAKTKSKVILDEPSDDEEAAKLKSYRSKQRTVIIDSSSDAEEYTEEKRPPKRVASITDTGRSSISGYKSDTEKETKTKYRHVTRSSVDVRKSSENKENEISNQDITTFRNLIDLSLSENYERVFGSGSTLPLNKGDAHAQSNSDRESSHSNSLNDSQQANCKVETVLADGSRATKYPNGNVKTISADGNLVKMEYFNGDIKETALVDGTVKYFYKDTSIWQTTFKTGDETFEFPDGQVEKHYANGSSHVQFPNGIIKHINTDGSEQINYPDGSVVNIKVNGEKVLLLPNGQKEIHTDKHKRREYPDGTVKIIYNDGLQETRYSNGRIRMKDRDGNLIMDSHKDS